MLERLSPILPTRDVQAAEAFWTRLGFTTLYKDAAYLLVERDAVEAHFWLNPTLDPQVNDAGAYLRADVDALDAEWGGLGLPDTGVPRLVRAEDKPWGMRELALIDPDGNLIRAGRPIDD